MKCKIVKRVFVTGLAVAMAVGMMAGCGGGTDAGKNGGQDAGKDAREETQGQAEVVISLDTDGGKLVVGEAKPDGDGGSPVGTEGESTVEGEAKAEGGAKAEGDTLTLKAGEWIGGLPACEKEGYVFCGWYDGDGKCNPFDVATKDRQLKAKWIKDDVKIEVSFDVNDGSGDMLSKVTVEANGHVATENLPEVPTREDYYFAGWQTRPEITEDDLVGGVSKYLYYAGESKSMAGIWNQEYVSIVDAAAQIENIGEDGKATLYARWVPLKKISSEAELDDIRQDLYGAYQLAEDVTLTKPWKPVGSYYGNYELLNDNWWIHSFHGYFDGNGKTISGLQIDTVENVPEEGANMIVDEGTSNSGTTAFFGSVSTGAVVKDVVFQDAVVRVEQIGGHCYVASVVGFMMGGEMHDVSVENATVEVVSRDSKDTTLYTSASVLAGGFWGGAIRDCKVDGSLSVRAVGENLGSGQVYLGSLVGECYSEITGCGAECTVDLQVEAVDSTEEEVLQVNVGGITASNCFMEKCEADSQINVSIDKKNGGLVVMSALGIGSERYGYIRGCTANGTLKVETTNEGTPVVNQGSILGGFEGGVYDLIAMYDEELKTKVVEGCRTDNAGLPFIGAPYEDNEMVTFDVRDNEVVTK